MKILAAENSVSYTANNAIKIYIIKQTDYSNKNKFEKEDYYELLGDATDTDKAINLNNAAHSGENGIRLVKLLHYDKQQDNLYQECPIFKTIDRPDFKLDDGNKPQNFYFLKSLFSLRNCPLIDFSQLAYVFQMNGQSQSGLANLVSFTTNFNVNGQSSAEIVLNNKDFKYNFKYFNNKEKYPFHLKSYFDTNDIIIIRCQKKNVVKSDLISSFKTQHIDSWEDPYLESETDPFTTIFTGYINDVNDAFSFATGQQTVTLSCTGPSKRLTWTRFLSNKAAASKDSLSAVLPLSAYINPQTFNNENKASISNDEVVSNLIVRTYSGVLNIPKVKEAFDTFVKAFDENNNIRTSQEIKELEKKINDSDIKDDIKKLDAYNKELEQKKSNLQKVIQKSRDDYNSIIQENMDQFVDGNRETGWIAIAGNRFTTSSIFGNPPYIFKIEGTNQPAYQWTFNNWSSLFKSDFSTVYQFIKGIADNLQFNFYDDPYGTIHFSIPNMTLAHLEKDNHPNNLTQIINFSESQNTENIANVQYCEAKYLYDLPFDMINTVAKDYSSIKKYGEKMMQPFSMIGLTNPAAIRYAARMRMAKYNRKALSNIRVTINGEPYLKLDKYAYIKSLRKLFYIESYSHSYQAGGQFTTSLNGTYTREILSLVDIKQNSKQRIDTQTTAIVNSLTSVGNVVNASSALNGISPIKDKVEKLAAESSFNQQLENATTMSDIFSILDLLEFPDPKILSQQVYQIYIDNWDYPSNDENLKFDVASMYNAKNLRQCYLDGFFWALPFDVNPYAMAQQIQEDELKAVKQLTKTIAVNTSLSKTKPEIINNKVSTENFTTQKSGSDTIKGISNFDISKTKYGSESTSQTKTLTASVSNKGGKYKSVFNTEGLINL